MTKKEFFHKWVDVAFEDPDHEVLFMEDLRLVFLEVRADEAVENLRAIIAGGSFSTGGA